jgi:hypothetical protein
MCKIGRLGRRPKVGPIPMLAAACLVVGYPLQGRYGPLDSQLNWRNCVLLDLDQQEFQSAATLQ